MTEDRPADAAKMFERTVNLAGREQAQYSRALTTQMRIRLLRKRQAYNSTCSKMQRDRQIVLFHPVPRWK